MNNELRFSTSKNAVIVYRGDAMVAAIYPSKASRRQWELWRDGVSLAVGTPAKLRRLAVKRFCQCADCAR